MFATVTDVTDRLGRDSISAVEEANISALLEGAQALIETYIGVAEDDIEGIEEGVPPILRMATVSIVVRTLANPTGLSSRNEQIGSYQLSESFGRDLAGELTLSKSEELVLRRAVWGKTTGSSRQAPALVEPRES